MLSPGLTLRKFIEPCESIAMDGPIEFVTARIQIAAIFAVPPARSEHFTNYRVGPRPLVERVPLRATVIFSRDLFTEGGRRVRKPAAAAWVANSSSGILIGCSLPAAAL